MNKLLIISGPTATGKTALAELIAKMLPSELISADSRQVYIGLDIGTGKDHKPDTKIHLIDIVTPDQKFSAYDFSSLARQKIQQIQSRNKLPIVVGGTGYYLNALLNPHSFVSPNIQDHFLFPVFNKLDIKILKIIYKFLAGDDFALLNNAEQNNPHRLIKKILLNVTNKNNVLKTETLQLDILHIHLDAPTEILTSKIDARIEKRLESGLLAEISKLLEKYNFSSPGLTSLAYKELESFFKETDTLENCIQIWKNHEHQYLKRQKTYFTKFFPNTSSFDISANVYPQNVIKTTISWYNRL